MAATAQFLGDDTQYFGSVPVRFANLTLDNSYPAGGYVLTGQEFGGASTGGGFASNNGIRGVIVLGQNTAGAGGYVFEYNSQTGKLQAFWTGAVISTALGEVTAATDLSAVVLNLLVLLAGN